MMKRKSVGGVSREKFYEPDSDCLRKHNYSTGAGWKASKRCKHQISWAIKSKVRGSIYGLRDRRW